MQQRAAKIVLQAPDLLAYGRLGPVNALASASKATRIDDRDKAAEQIEFEHLKGLFGFSLKTILTFNFQMTIRALNRALDERRRFRCAPPSPLLLRSPLAGRRIAVPVLVAAFCLVSRSVDQARRAEPTSDCSPRLTP